MDQLPQQSLVTYSVLIAKDEPIIALLARELVEDLGGHVIGVTQTCASALQMLSVTKPDLILLDVKLSGGTSEAVVNAASLRNIAILISSGSDRQNLPSLFCELPMVQKPWTAEELKSALINIAHQIRR